MMPIAGLPGSKTGRPACWRKARAKPVVVDAHAKIRLQRAEPEIEQDAVAIFDRAAPVRQRQAR